MNTTYIVCINIVAGDESSGGGGYNFIVSTASIHVSGPWFDPVSAATSESIWGPY
ncbi:hypothetical protein HK100_005084 [Physocladia obscura]|uniref:Uncharacterized protein n=1 Tax=Physocladia obscura TaxID=109957 RepID=A0AAD5XC49_9FUNG|nr:hypothetical protein HK100_005084 [Physocladia obscura]